MRDIMPPVQNSLLYPLLRLKARRLPAVQLESLFGKQIDF